MVEVLALIIACLGGFSASVVYFQAGEARRTQAAVEFERSRVTELLQLLEARSAPAEYAAYVQPFDAESPTQNWVFTEDGLIGVPVEDE